MCQKSEYLHKTVLSNLRMRKLGISVVFVDVTDDTKSVRHDWCTKMSMLCAILSGMMHIKRSLLLIEKSSLS